MSSTSPASTNSGHSGQSKEVTSVCNSISSSPLSLVQLHSVHPDPVKLIDERIKVFTGLMATCGILNCFPPVVLYE